MSALIDMARELIWRIAAEKRLDRVIDVERLHPLRAVAVIEEMGYRFGDLARAIAYCAANSAVRLWGAAFKQRRAVEFDGKTPDVIVESLGEFEDRCGELFDAFLELACGDGKTEDVFSSIGQTRAALGKLEEAVDENLEALGYGLIDWSYRASDSLDQLESMAVVFDSYILSILDKPPEGYEGVRSLLPGASADRGEVAA